MERHCMIVEFIILEFVAGVSMTYAEKIKKDGPVICCIGIASSLPIAMIVMGAIYLDNCPAERYISIYLIVFGCFSVVLAVTMMIGTCIQDEEGKKPKAIWGFFKLMLIVMSLCLIAGSVWIYRIYNTYDPDNIQAANYCHNTFYLFAFWVTTGVYIFLTLGFCVIVSACGFLTYTFEKGLRGSSS